MRDWRLGLAAFVLIGAALVIWQPHADEPWTATGRPSRLLDGDTIELAGERVRIWGIDAPELGQPCIKPGDEVWDCGEGARFALWLLLSADDRPVTCAEAGDKIDKYGRRLAICRIGETDLGGMLIDQGLAMANREYTDHYNAREDAARSRGLGIWETEFMPPWEWRHRSD